MTTAVLGLGGNIGDVRATMAAALDVLAAGFDVDVEAVSALYETPPWGNTEQPAFLNAAARISTSLSARELLDAVLATEQRLGRHRAERWGPRTIDIDILIFGTGVVDEPGLTIPHPRLAERAFALAPLADVAPETEFGGRSADEWLETSDRSGIVRIAGPDWYRPGLVT